MIDPIFDSLKTIEPEEDWEEVQNYFSESHPVYGKALLKGYKWITNGVDTSMIAPTEMPPVGWHFGRPNPHTDVEQFRKQQTQNNSNAKTYLVEYRDGGTEVVHSLNTWAREKGISISSIKAKVRQSKTTQQFHKLSSPTYHIKSIKRLV